MSFMPIERTGGYLPIADHGLIGNIAAAIGASLRAVAGYPTTNDVRVGVERGEIRGMCLGWESVQSASGEWLESGYAKVFVQNGTSRHPDLQDVPLALEFAKDEDSPRLLRLVDAPGAMAKPFAMPPGVDPARVQIMRDALQATFRDEAFLAEPETMNLAFSRRHPSRFGRFSRTCWRRRRPSPPSTGLPMPAAAEIVVEGWIRPERVLREGPFGEWTGYYSGSLRPVPTMDVERLYFRNSPIILGTPPGKPPNDGGGAARGMRRSTERLQDPVRQTPSLDHLDSRVVSRCRGQWCVAGDDRRIECLRQSNVHGVVRRDVLAQPPRASQEIEMGVTVEIEVGEIRNRFRRAVR
jgi:hypothetical protein